MKDSIQLHFSVIEGRQCASCNTVLRSRYATYVMEENKQMVRLCYKCSSALERVLEARKAGGMK